MRDRGLYSGLHVCLTRSVTHSLSQLLRTRSSSKLDKNEHSLSLNLIKVLSPVNGILSQRCHNYISNCQFSWLVRSTSFLFWSSWIRSRLLLDHLCWARSLTTYSRFLFSSFLWNSVHEYLQHCLYALQRRGRESGIHNTPINGTPLGIQEHHQLHLQDCFVYYVVL